MSEVTRNEPERGDEREALRKTARATALAAARAWAACPCEDHAAAALSSVSPAFAAGEDAAAYAAATAAFSPAYAGILARAAAAHAAEQASRYGQSVLEALEALWSLDS